MSRIGKKPVKIPSGVTVTHGDRALKVKGPKGELEMALPREIEFELANGFASFSNPRPARDRHARAFHGLARALLQNLVLGVTAGYERKLEINGVGYNVAAKGTKLVFNLGFSHTVEVDVPSDLKVECPNQTNLIIRGCDKQRVGQLAAQIRKLKPPEPYKGKGIKYDFEVIKRKAGKAFGSA